MCHSGVKSHRGFHQPEVLERELLCPAVVRMLLHRYFHYIRSTILDLSQYLLAESDTKEIWQEKPRSGNIHIDICCYQSATTQVHLVSLEINAIYLLRATLIVLKVNLYIFV